MRWGRKRSGPEQFGLENRELVKAASKEITNGDGIGNKNIGAWPAAQARLWKALSADEQAGYIARANAPSEAKRPASLPSRKYVPLRFGRARRAKSCIESFKGNWCSASKHLRLKSIVTTVYEWSRFPRFKWDLRKSWWIREVVLWRDNLILTCITGTITIKT